MPKLRYNNYILSVASDDLALVSVYNLFWRLLWFITILILTIQSSSEINSCKHDTEWFLFYLCSIMLLILISIIIQIIIGYTSVQGTMVNIKPRENMGLYLIIHFILCVCHFSLTLIGVISILIDARPCHDSTIYSDKHLLYFIIFTQVIDTTLSIIYLSWLKPTRTNKLDDNDVDYDDDNINFKTVNSITLWENRLRNICCILHRGCCNILGGIGDLTPVFLVFAFCNNLCILDWSISLCTSVLTYRAKEALGLDAGLGLL